MNFKEFASWCNDRAADGCWGMMEAICCCDAASKIYKQPFWKREKIWQMQYKDNVMPIVEATNKKIKEIFEAGPMGCNMYPKIERKR